MHIKVRGGTPPGERGNLCESCRHARIVRGRAIDEEIVFCDASPMRAERITFKVTSCSDHSDHRHATYWELIQQAWILQPGSRKRQAGFVRAKDLGADNLAELPPGLRRSRER